MNKLTILQIMNLAEKLQNTEWISLLITLNNSGKLEQFLQMMNQPDLLQSVLTDTKKSNTR